MSRPRKRFGQHFLEPAWVDKLVAAIDPQPNQTFLEIGPGRGAITRPLAARAARVVAIEIDRDLSASLRLTLPDVDLHTADVISTDLGQLGLPPGTRVAGNLPYNLSSPILFQLLQTAARTDLFADATLMLQKEVADRIVAPPGSGDYGVLTVFVSVGARVTRLLNLPPGAFRPPPAVSSAVVRLTFLHADERPRVPPAFGPTVRTLFSRRRKTLLNGLRPLLAGRAAEALDAAGLDARRRPETLDREELLRLAAAVTRVAGEPG